MPKTVLSCLLVFVFPMVLLAQNRPRPVPAVESQAEALKLIQGLYKPEYASRKPADRLAFAEKLFMQGMATNDDFTARFVLFSQARELAVAGGNLRLAWKACDELGKDYATDLVSMKAAVLAGSLKSGVQANRGLIEKHFRLTEQAITLEKWELAESLLHAAQGLAKTYGDAHMQKHAQALIQQVAEIQENQAAFNRSRMILSQKPLDRDANLQVGRSLCLLRGQWDKGLPLLTNGENATVVSLAKIDAESPVDSASQVSLADKWWTLGETETGTAKRQLHLRAYRWYASASPTLNGITLTRVETRMREVERAYREQIAPRPIACWTFEKDARDTIETMHGTLPRGATVTGDRLHFRTKGLGMITAPLPLDIKERTLEIWVALPSLNQQNAYLMEIFDTVSGAHDGIMYADKQAMKWVSHSSFRHRTQELDGPVESAKPTQLIHVAVAYKADNSIAVYRNGKLYGQPYVPQSGGSTIQTYHSNRGHIVLGKDSIGAIEESRLYDFALSEPEIGMSYRIGPRSAK